MKQYHQSIFIKGTRKEFRIKDSVCLSMFFESFCDPPRKEKSAQNKARYDERSKQDVLLSFFGVIHFLGQKNELTALSPRDRIKLLLGCDSGDAKIVIPNGAIGPPKGSQYNGQPSPTIESCNHCRRSSVATFLNKDVAEMKATRTASNMR